MDFSSSSSVSKNRHTFLQRHVFWRKLSVEEKDSFDLVDVDRFRWIEFDAFTKLNLDTESCDIVAKLRHAPSGNPRL